MNASTLLKKIVPAAAVLVLCGCPSMQTRSLAQPERVAVRGAYVHSASKITMPESIAGFQRDNVSRYDADSLDVSGGYNLVTPSHRIAATVYVYPSPSLTSIGSPPDVVAGARARLAEGEFEARKQEIRQAHPGAILVQQREMSRTQSGQSHAGKFAIFEYEEVFAGSRTRLRSRLYLFCYVGGKWTVKYRFTHPKSEDADREIQGFIEKWSWYGEGV
jgi:hypothetical protein